MNDKLPEYKTDELNQLTTWRIYKTDLKRASILLLQLDKNNQQDLFRFLLNHYADHQLTKQE